MPRDYAQIRQDMWSDDRWRGLTPAAQWLYMLLLSDPRLTYAGVTEWHPGRIAQRANECTGRDVLIAAAELAAPATEPTTRTGVNDEPHDHDHAAAGRDAG